MSFKSGDRGVGYLYRPIVFLLKGKNVKTHTQRQHDQLFIHFRCDLCGRVQSARLIDKDEMLHIITDDIRLMGERVCDNCVKAVGDAIEGVAASEWEKRNGLNY